MLQSVLDKLMSQPFKAVRVIYSLVLLIGMSLLLALAVPAINAPDWDIEEYLAFLIFLVPVTACLAATAWAQPAVFLAFGMFNAAVILAPWTLYGERNDVPFLSSVPWLPQMLLASVIVMGLFCRFIALVSVPPSSHLQAGSDASSMREFDSEQSKVRAMAAP